jgi:hypothetical protein
MRYNYVLSGGLDFGVAICSLLIFFVVILPKGGIQVNWWGNSVYLNTTDANGTPFKSLAPGEKFGPVVYS